MDRADAWAASVSAPAKINLTLRVHGRRGDGFCELTSLVVGVGLCDTVRLAITDSGRIRLSCDSNELSDGDDNLVVRAARLLAQRTGTSRGARMELEKVVPIGAGLGGGSSDAAATLSALNRLWQTGLTEAKLSELGAELGSDVPLFFHLPAAVIRGRGEIVEPVRLDWSGWAALLFGGLFVSTKEVYEALQSAKEFHPADDERIDAILHAAQADAIGPHLVNDLEPAVFRVSPAVERLFHRVQDTSGRFARISGAGSTVYTLFDDEADAGAWAENMKRRELGTGTAVVRVPQGNARAS